ncbi:hypothetical protein MMC25_003818 [Agyrium rufum]|nr:hypothetical protein [Agyrium rufum]
MARLVQLLLLVHLFCINASSTVREIECKALSKLFSGKVFFPGSIPYNESVGSYFAAFEDELSPTCVVRPANANDVSNIIRLVSVPALLGQLQFAVRGGGHTPWAGAANIDNGITIDMQNMTGVKVNARTGVASIGSGERWSSVYQTLGSQGLTIVGGRVSKVGVAGLTTGGGLSYFSATTGFVCDNVINYEIVLADGSIVNANLQSHPDLFIALKGGSNNFAVVTRFDFPTFKQGAMWGGEIAYNATAYPGLMKAFYDFAAAPNADLDAHLIAAASYSGGLEVGVADIYHITPRVNPPSLAPFVTLEPQLGNTLRQDSLLGFAEEQSAFSTDELLGVHDLYLQTIASLEKASVAGLTLSLVYQPLTKGILAASAKRSGNSLGLGGAEAGPLVITLINSVHQKASDDDTVIAAALGLVAQIDALAARRQRSATYRFTNYGYKTQDIIQGYGQASVRRLQAVSQKYDPLGFFQKAVPGGFKIPKS